MTADKSTEVFFLVSFSCSETCKPDFEKKKLDKNCI